MLKKRSFKLAILTIILSAAFVASKAHSEEAQRAVLSYKGWAVLKKQVLEPEAADDAWISMRDISITDDGKKITFMDGDQATPYALELIVITYEQSNTTVLKLALYEEGKDKSVAYIWGEPGAKRLGMNLRWMQAGFTRVDQ